MRNLPSTDVFRSPKSGARHLLPPRLPSQGSQNLVKGGGYRFAVGILLTFRERPHTTGFFYEGVVIYAPIIYGRARGSVATRVFSIHRSRRGRGSSDEVMENNQL
jgi:hypothetical protein